MSNALSRRRVISKHTIFTAVNASSDSGVSSLSRHTNPIFSGFFVWTRLNSPQVEIGSETHSSVNSPHRSATVFPMNEP